MSTDLPVRRPRHLWIVGALALLWNAFGAFDYLATQLKVESYLAQFTPEQRAYFDSFPSWAVAAWAFGVWGAVAGSIGLLMGRAWAVWAFAISLAGMLVSWTYQFAMSDGNAVMGNAAIWMNVTITAVGIALLWYAMRQRSRGILR